MGRWDKASHLEILSVVWYATPTTGSRRGIKMREEERMRKTKQTERYISLIAKAWL